MSDPRVLHRWERGGVGFEVVEDDHFTFARMAVNDLEFTPDRIDLVLELAYLAVMNRELREELESRALQALADDAAREDQDDG